MNDNSRPQPPNDAPDFSSTQEMSVADRALVDILHAVRRPDGRCMICVDFTNAEAFRIARGAQTGVPITLIDMTLRALALACNSRKEFRTLIKGYKRFVSPTLDIGCSIATASGTLLSPVIVFQNAPALSLEELHHERLQKIKITRQEEEARIKELERLTRPFPDFLRERIIAKYMDSPQNRKRLSGTIAFTSIELNDMEWISPSHMSGAMIAGMGGIKKRPLVVETEQGTQIEARLCANVTFMIDQRIVHPLRAMRAARKFKNFIEQPERLV